MLTIAVSSRALFNIEDGHAIFQEKGRHAFDAYMREKELVPLRPGVAFALVRKLLAMNPVGTEPLVGVVLLSRNSSAAGQRVMNSVRHYALPIERAVFTQGAERFTYAKAFAANLFLSASAADVRQALEHGMAAATLLPTSQVTESADKIVRIAFDGDSVIFSDEAEQVFQQSGLAAFVESEQQLAKVPLTAGPFKPVLAALHALREAYGADCPVQIALVTTRGVAAADRVQRTLGMWGLEVDTTIFAGGYAKGPLLEGFGADLFFDDTMRHVESAAGYVGAGHVPSGVVGSA